jgi:predicted TIM-barrel fold metal-dependent hydrolase
MSPDTTHTTDNRDPETIRREIEQTRRELGDTVAAVAEKADVKAQLKTKAEHTKERVLSGPRHVAERAKHATPHSVSEATSVTTMKASEYGTALAIAGVGLCAFGAGLLVGRRR